MKSSIRTLRTLLSVLFSVLMVMMSSCAGKSEGDYYGAEAYEPEPSLVARSESMAPSVSMDKSSPADGTVSTEDALAAEPAEGATDADETESRKRVYNGSAGLVVEDPEESRRELERTAVDAGGYVESSYEDYVVLRVPAADFEQIYREILAMGRVEYSRVETWDVTEQFADIERRLNTAEETRARLYVLLERSTDPQERARILREIGRLTEEIESLRQQIALLESRIAFSRITVQLIPRIQADYSRDQIPFSWIAWIDPITPAGSRLSGRLTLEPGDDFAVFSKDRSYIAENSDGVLIMVSTLENNPRGDSGFWRNALAFHLGPYYASVRELDLKLGDSPLPGVELVSKDREPFRYFVGVLARGRDLHVVEIFSPDAGTDFLDYYRALAEGSLK